MEQQQAPDRNLAMELARVTEAAALAAGRWMGRGDKEAADQAAVDAMRLVVNNVSMDGVVVIGEGEKDEAPMLYNGEQIGAGGPPCDIAVDPIDGTTLTALGRPNAIAVIALSERGTMFDPGPCVYMEKIAVGPEAADVIDLEASVTHNLQAVAKALGEDIDDVTAVILERDRHDEHHQGVPRGGRQDPADPRRRRRRSDLDGVAGERRQRPVRHRRHAGGRDRRVRLEGAGWRHPRSALAPRRGRASRRQRRRLRPQPRAHDRRSRRRVTTCSSRRPA